MAHPSVARQEPQRPADAYPLVARLLPPGYFTCPPPPTGVLLEAQGRDGRVTRWSLPRDISGPVIRVLRRTPGVTVRTALYGRQEVG